MPRKEDDKKDKKKKSKTLNGDVEAVKDKEKKGSKKDKPAPKPASKPAPKTKPQRKIPAFDEPSKGKNAYLGDLDLPSSDSEGSEDEKEVQRKEPRSKSVV